MKLAMPKDEEMLNQHFGQSKNFLIATIENNQVVDRQEISTDSLQHNHAGLSGLLISQGVSLVILGGIGQPSLEALKMRDLDVIRGASGSCEGVLQKYLLGQLAACGERTFIHKLQNVDGKNLCIPCSEKQQQYLGM